MRLLLHVCCGPCALMPIQELLDQGHAVTGYFDNPNIHPLTEYFRRREGALAVAARMGIDLVFPDAPEYDAAAWCRAALADPAGRCAYCRNSRFHRAAAFARAGGYEGFSSSLLYSRRQDHQGMIDAGRRAEAANGISFVYHDFRTAWQAGIEQSKAWGIYRQQYCGCLFSEQDRYQKDMARLQADVTAHVQTRRASQTATGAASNAQAPTVACGTRRAGTGPKQPAPAGPAQS